MHVSYKRNKPNITVSRKRLLLSEKEYELLTTYIRNSFQIGKNKPLAIVHPGYSDVDCFYEANGTYNLFNTCNVWTGCGLKEAGVTIGIWTPLQNGIVSHLK